MPLLEAMIYGVRQLIDSAGNHLPKRSRVKFTGTVTDDPDNDQTIVDVGGGGSATVADDIGKVGSDIARVLGFKGIPFETSDTLSAGDVWLKKGSKLRAGRSAPAGHTDATTNGCVADGTTDNAAAMQAIVDAVALAAGAGLVVHCGPGTYYFTDNLVLTRPVEFTGLGGSVSNTTVGPGVTFKFAAGKGLVIPGPNQGYRPNGNTCGTGSKVRGVKLLAEASLAPAVWTNGASKVVGDTVRHTDHNRYFYSCIQAGTTDASEPAFQNCYLTDCTTTLPANGAQVYKGATVRDLAQSTVVFWECTTEGARGTGTPTFDTTPGNTTTDGAVTWTCRSAAGHWIVDNGVIWSCRQAAGIWVRARCVLEDLYVEGFTTAAISGLSTVYPTTNCNHTRVTGIRTFGCGTGIVWRGLDASQWYVEHCDVATCGTNYSPLGAGGVSIWDGSFLGSQVVACEVAGGSGQAYITGRYDIEDGSENGFGGSLIGCYSEGGDLPSYCSTGTVVIGGDHGAGFDSRSSYVGFFGSGGHSIRETDPGSAKHVAAYLNLRAADTVLGYGSDDESSYLGTSYVPADFPLDGFYGDSYDYGTRAGFGFTGLACVLGAGWNVQPLGVFQGGSRASLAGMYFKGLDAASMHSSRVRGPAPAGHTYGSYEVGDRFELQSTGVAGTFTGFIVKTAGIRGNQPWLALQGVGSETYVEPTATWSGTASLVGGKVFHCSTTGTGTTDASEPDWSTATVINDTVAETGGSGVVWTLIGFVPEYEQIGYVGTPSGSPTTTFTLGNTEEIRGNDGGASYVTMACVDASANLVLGANAAGALHSINNAYLYASNTIYLCIGGAAKFNISGDGARFFNGDLADGSGVIAIANATTAPTTNPAGGGILYCDAGALKYRGSSGTVSTIAPA